MEYDSARQMPDRSRQFSGEAALVTNAIAKLLFRLAAMGADVLPPLETFRTPLTFFVPMRIYMATFRERAVSLARWRSVVSRHGYGGLIWGRRETPSL